MLRTEKKLEEKIEFLDKWSRLWQIPKYLYLLEILNVYRGQKS